MELAPPPSIYLFISIIINLMKSRPPFIMSMHVKLLILFYLLFSTRLYGRVTSHHFGIWTHIPINAQLHKNRRPFVCKDELTSLAPCRCLFNASLRSLVAPELMRLPPSVCCTPARFCQLRQGVFCLLVLYYSLAPTINRQPHFIVSFEALTCSAV